jgi:hypothetical protein
MLALKQKLKDVGTQTKIKQVNKCWRLNKD